MASLIWGYKMGIRNPETLLDKEINKVFPKTRRLFELIGVRADDIVRMRNCDGPSFSKSFGVVSEKFTEMCFALGKDQSYFVKFDHIPIEELEYEDVDCYEEYEMRKAIDIVKSVMSPAHFEVLMSCVVAGADGKYKNRFQDAKVSRIMQAVRRKLIHKFEGFLDIPEVESKKAKLRKEAADKERREAREKEREKIARELREQREADIIARREEYNRKIAASVPEVKPYVSDRHSININAVERRIIAAEESESSVVITIGNTAFPTVLSIEVEKSYNYNALVTCLSDLDAGSCRFSPWTAIHFPSVHDFLRDYNLFSKGLIDDCWCAASRR